jgi:hypothetical protein
LETTYRSAHFAPVPHFGSQRLSVTEATQRVCNDLLAQFERGYLVRTDAIPEAIYKAPAAAAAKDSRPDDDNSKGKTDTKPKKTPKPPHVVELLRPKTGTNKIGVKDQLLCHNGGKSPKVTIGGKTKSLCLRGCGTLLGTCTSYGKRPCSFYHFDPAVQGPPEGVDLSEVRTFLQLPAVQAILAPTDLGKKVLGL